jgi:D-alanyl-D-alanine carboxypeptidase
MRGRRWWEQRIFAALAALCITPLLAPQAAWARVHHRHHRHSPYLAPAEPFLQAPAGTELGPTAPGVSAIVINAGSGSVVSEAGADIPRYPASLTKLMTLDLAFQALRDGRLTLDTQLPVSVHASTVEPVKLGLMPGDTITVRQAILGMTTMSANDAATALGEYLGGGSEYRCAQMMTLRAHALGMEQTQFYNASGLPNPGQVTTARDLSILARDIVVNFPQYQPFFETLNFNFEGRTIYSNNGMLKLYPGAMGMKTGYTILARHNLITAAQRNGTILIGVELHEDSWGQSYTQMTAMLDYGFGGHIGGGNAILLASRQAPPAPANTQVASNLTPPSIPLPASASASLFPTADAATLQPLPGRNGKFADNRVTRNLVHGWTAQVGSYARMKYAKQQAITVHKMRGVGVARIARLSRHGKVLWAAQLAGLSQTAALSTCHAVKAHGNSCVVIAPQADHLAMRDIFEG